VFAGDDEIAGDYGPAKRPTRLGERLAGDDVNDPHRSGTTPAVIARRTWTWAITGRWSRRTRRWSDCGKGPAARGFTGA
jgi:hypothetical protein